jgi:nuclear receptor coactivator 6
MSDEDSNSCSNIHKTKSLLEQLLIEIPDNQTPSSPSPATRSVRTRALSKLSSPELNSPVSVAAAKSTRVATPASTTKRKRHESDSSNNSIEDARNKKTRKCSENAAELIKACMGVDAGKVNNVKKMTTTTSAATGKLQDESSDSDEPLIEKVRKTATTINSVTKNKLKSGNGGIKGVAVSTRRSVRTAIPAPNTRSKGDKVGADSEALRRKTRSAVSEGDSKRKKEVK